MNSSINEAVNGGRSARYGHPVGTGELISVPARELLNLRRLPAMLNGQQAAAVLGVGEHDIPALIRSNLLEPLGDPQANAVKYFAAIQVLEMAGDPVYLGKLRKAIYAYWQGKNSAKTQTHFRRNHGHR
jgi:hypothetical protein